MAKKLTPEQKRIRALERAIRDLLDHLSNHQCPYCGTSECPVTVAHEALRNEPHS